RTLPREELNALRDCRKYPGLYARSWHGTHPWRVDALRDAAKMVSGSRVAPCDLDLLFELAEQDTLNIGVRAFVFKQLMHLVSSFMRSSCFHKKSSRGKR
ncbi:MAG: hypothetical protein KAY24_18375, partial [Candidatus Eisenbacteria sp.]|nr:hypothetical protein [Candidatus Eisenbacteria bacterium]